MNVSEPTVDLRHGDCLEILRQLPDESVHAVITDPPYGLANTDATHVVETLSRWFAGERDYLPSGAGFMGKAWDAFVPPPAVWDECYRVLKPGGHLLAFAGSRTQDLMGLSIRLAGFDIRDGITWLYGSGFPKSLDVSKAIDKAAGAAREVTGREPRLVNARAMTPDGAGKRNVDPGVRRDAPATPEARQWHGWGTALKPASEPIVVARKPLQGTVAANVLAHGTGALNIDACRVGTSGGGTSCTRRDEAGRCMGHANAGRSTSGETFHGPDASGGRWPANVVLDEHAATALDADSGISTSRFFPVFKYQAKAPAKERPKVDGVAHPTVKPLDLMRWLVRLVTPPGGTVLEPFAGSGTTVEAALLEGFAVIGIEREADYLPLIQQRVERARAKAIEGAASGLVGSFEPAGEGGGVPAPVVPVEPLAEDVTLF